MKIVATIQEAADVIRKCEERKHRIVGSFCSDCVLRESCDGPLSLPDLFEIVRPEVVEEEDHYD